MSGTLKRKKILLFTFSPIFNNDTTTKEVPFDKPYSATDTYLKGETQTVSFSSNLSDRPKSAKGEIVLNTGEGPPCIFGVLNLTESSSCDQRPEHDRGPQGKAAC